MGYLVIGIMGIVIGIVIGFYIGAHKAGKNILICSKIDIEE